jgi:hypothetical protein
MEEPILNDPLEDIAVSEVITEKASQPSILSRIGSGLRDVGVSAGLELGANTLIGAASVAASPFVPPSVTAAVGTFAKEVVKTFVARGRQRKVVQEELVKFNAPKKVPLAKPLGVNTRTISIFEKYFDNDPNKTRNGLIKLRNKYPDASEIEIENILTESVPLF